MDGFENTSDLINVSQALAAYKRLLTKVTNHLEQMHSFAYIGELRKCAFIGLHTPGILEDK